MCQCIYAYRHVVGGFTDIVYIQWNGKNTSLYLIYNRIHETRVCLHLSVFIYTETRRERERERERERHKEAEREREKEKEREGHTHKRNLVEIYMATYVNT